MTASSHLLGRVAGLFFCGVLSSRIAGAEEVSAPDGRVRVGADASVSASGVDAHSFGNLGAFGFDNEVGLGPGRSRITNVPFYGAIGSEASGRCASGNQGCDYEEVFGPPLASATIGTGGVTEGVDRWGRLTVLGWPGPGHHDHVSYLNVTRGAPNQGAPENAGSFGGIGQSWLHPYFGWTVRSQGYEPEDGQTVVTVLGNESLGLEVTITDVVDPHEDLVARSFAFRRTEGGGEDLPPFSYYANLNPTTSRVPRIPSVFDAALDDLSDFATVYDSGTSTMLHFRPYEVDPASLSRLATSQPGAAAALDAVAGAFGPGVYVAIGGQAPAGEFQAGLESWGLVRAEAEGTPLADPYYDLVGDGRLSGSPAAFGKTAGAIGALPPDPDGSFTVYIAAEEDPAGAIGAIQKARLRGFRSIREDSEAWWRAWISRARLPATADPRTLAVARRALMLIRTAQDRTTGAIVANATPQTPYRQDWVRDGAFFNYALLLAGYPEMALHHAEFYRGVYRPGGTWDSLYYTDGAEAGFVFPYEIDSQAFALWALWLPYELGAGGRGYLESVYPAIRDTADAILLCRDPFNGMQCFASEDDNPIPSQGAQGAATVYLALRAAAEAAGVLGDESSRERWESRAVELRETALSRVCGADQCQGGRGGVYLVWPSRLVDPLDPATAGLAQSHLGQYARELDCRSFQDPGCDPPRVGDYLQYPMEPVLALAPFWDDADRDGRLDGWIRWLAHEVAAPGVLHYGERIFFCDGASPCEPGEPYLHTIGFPHVWSGTEMYLASAFVYGVTGCPAGATRIGEAACR